MSGAATGARAFKDAVYEQLARIGKAVASPKRLELLELLCQGPRTVEDLAAQGGASVANTSQHLQILRAARLIEADRQGTYVRYRLADDEVCRFYVGLRGLAELRITELHAITEAYLRARGALEPIDAAELLSRARDGRVTVLDVRPASEYAAGHLPGARSVPLGELSTRLAELPRDRPVVAYCRGPYCVMAIAAVELLREAGLEAHRLEQGPPDWLAAGVPLERS